MTKTAELADVLLPATSWGEHAGVSPVPIAAFSVSAKPLSPAAMSGATGRSSACWPRKWAIPCITRITSRSGTKCASCAPFYGVTYEKWARWVMCSGPVQPSIIPALPTCTRIISSTPHWQRPAICRPGAPRRRHRMRITRWYCAQCAKWATTPAAP